MSHNTVHWTVFSFVAIDVLANLWQKLADIAKLLFEEFRHGHNEHFATRQNEGLC